MCKSLLFLILPSFLLAADPNIKLVSAPRQSPRAAQPVAPTLVTVAPMPASLGVLPCFNCVYLQNPPNIGIPLPEAAIPTGTDVVFTMVIDDYAYTGSCSATFNVLINRQMSQTFTYDLPSGCTASTNYLITWQTNIGQVSGPAAIKGVVNAGGSSRSITTTFTAGAPTDAVGLAFISAASNPTGENSSVPCKNCALGSSSPSLGLLPPITTLALNEYSEFVVWTDVYSFTGPCQIQLAITQNGVGVLRTPIQNSNCAPGKTLFGKGFFRPTVAGGYTAFGSQYDDSTQSEAINELNFSAQ